MVDCIFCCGIFVLSVVLDLWVGYGVVGGLRFGCEDFAL